MHVALFLPFNHDHCSTILTPPGRGVRLTWTEEKPTMTSPGLRECSKVASSDLV
ncbi:unnamed protein product [Ectocarpus sp. 13 AM-2016]